MKLIKRGWLETPSLWVTPLLAYICFKISGNIYDDKPWIITISILFALWFVLYFKIKIKK